MPSGATSGGDEEVNRLLSGRVVGPPQQGAEAVCYRARLRDDPHGGAGGHGSSDQSVDEAGLLDRLLCAGGHR
jgi:hypothetical protein